MNLSSSLFRLKGFYVVLGAAMTVSHVEMLAGGLMVCGLWGAFVPKLGGLQRCGTGASPTARMAAPSS